MGDVNAVANVDATLGLLWLKTTDVHSTAGRERAVGYHAELGKAEQERRGRVARSEAEE